MRRRRGLPSRCRPGEPAGFRGGESRRIGGVRRQRPAGTAAFQVPFCVSSYLPRNDRAAGVGSGVWRQPFDCPHPGPEPAPDFQIRPFAHGGNNRGLSRRKAGRFRVPPLLFCGHQKTPGRAPCDAQPGCERDCESLRVSGRFQPATLKQTQRPQDECQNTPKAIRVDLGDG